MDQMPPPVRRLVSAFEGAVEEKFPSSKYIVSTAYLFLRVIMPCIAQPDKFGMCARPIDERDRRNLMLVAKVLQNLANGKHFGDKEVCMKAMNPFIDKALKQLQDYMMRLGQNGSAPDGSRIDDDCSDLEDQMHLHRMLLQVILLRCPIELHSGHAAGPLNTPCICPLTQRSAESSFYAARV